MEYVNVESSQIAAVGYDPETQTLGLKFPPNKRQPEGAEYHYANVSPRTHQALMAAPSIGSYFGQNIKAHPEQYPYTKVEADPHQPRPSNGMSGAKMESMPLTQTPTLEATDAPSPVTSLAVIDTLENSALFASGGVTDAQFAAGREWYLANAPKGIETEEKRTALKRFARPLQKLRTGIEARAKEFTGETKRKLAAIDTEKRRLVLLVGGIEDEVLRPLTEWEQEEDARKFGLATKLGYLQTFGQVCGQHDTPWIEAAIAELEAFDVSTMQEYKVGAESAITASLRVLKPELERRRVADANARELAELRRKQAERDEQDRINAKAAEIAAQRIAEMTPLPAATAPSKGFGSPAAVQASQEYTVAEHRQKIMDEAAEALLGRISRPDAMWVVSAIADGEIPHVTIAY